MIERLQRNEREAYEAGNLRESTRCLELLGKTIALFTERIEVDQQVLLGPRTIIMNMPDGSVIEESQETAEEATRSLSRPATGQQVRSLISSL